MGLLQCQEGAIKCSVLYISNYVTCNLCFNVMVLLFPYVSWHTKVTLVSN
jgi:hypothetical protein